MHLRIIIGISMFFSCAHLEASAGDIVTSYENWIKELEAFKVRLIAKAIELDKQGLSDPDSISKLRRYKACLQDLNEKLKIRSSSPFIRRVVGRFEISEREENQGDSDGFVGVVWFDPNGIQSALSYPDSGESLIQLDPQGINRVQE